MQHRTSKFTLRLAMLAALIVQIPAGQANTVSEAVPVGGIGITDIIREGVNALPGCLNYCITGVCVHLEPTAYGVEVIISPRIAHNTAEFIVSSFRAQGQQPWTEWRRVFGHAQASLSDGIFNMAFSTPGQVGGYGTYTEEHGVNDRQAPMKEVDINGHPLSILPEMLSSGGGLNNNNQQTQQPTEQDFTEAQEVANGMVDSSEFGSTFMNPEILDIFSTDNAMNQIGASASEVSQVMDYITEMQNLVSGAGGSGNYNLMCESTVTSFMPYYLSALNTLTWRLPWTDVLTHATELGYGLLPFAANRPVIGTPDAMPTLGSGTWGGLYPRMGFVRSEHDGKVGAVVSQRAMDLVLAERGNDHFGHLLLGDPGFANRGEWHIIPYRFHSAGIEGGVWQPVYPTPRYRCTASVYRDKELADLVVDNSAPRSISQNQNYIWTFWRRYECCMNRRGIFAAAVPVGPLCVIGENVDDSNTGFETGPEG